MNERIAFPFTAEVKPEHLAALERARIYLGVSGAYEKSWLQKQRKIYFDRPVYSEPMSCFATGARFFSLGAYSYSKSCFPVGISIGRYCSIGDSVSVMPASHPTDRLTTSGLDYANYPFFPPGFIKVKPNSSPLTLSIGNDVWIGQGAVLARGIKVGDGAVIAMRSIVTKDVPPYAVVAGAPATVRKFRFNERLIERLIASQWFSYDPADFCHLNTLEPERFLETFEELRGRAVLKPYTLQKIALHHIFHLS